MTMIRQWSMNLGNEELVMAIVEISLLIMAHVLCRKDLL